MYKSTSGQCDASISEVQTELGADTDRVQGFLGLVGGDDEGTVGQCHVRAATESTQVRHSPGTGNQGDLVIAYLPSLWYLCKLPGNG